MDFDLWSFTIDNLEAAGVIGGYVSISIVGFALLTFVTKAKFAGRSFAAPRWSHPLIGSALGVVPGCGATIVVASLYKRGKISFGGLFAAFIATLGEGSFVLLGASDESDVASNLSAFVTVNLVGLFVGAIVGVVVDRVKLAEPQMASTSFSPNHDESIPNKTMLDFFVNHLGFYLLIAMAVFLFPGSVMAFWGGGISALDSITVWVSIALTACCIAYHFAHRSSHGNCSDEESKTLKSALTHSIADVALVVTYVFVGLFAANFVIDVLVGAERFDDWMNSSAALVVVLAAFIGATPGCGGMIAVAAAYTIVPQFPIAALIAAGIATSGDGIFPLLASNKKDAIKVTAAGLLIALVVGYGSLALGVS